MKKVSLEQFYPFDTGKLECRIDETVSFEISVARDETNHIFLQEALDVSVLLKEKGKTKLAGICVINLSKFLNLSILETKHERASLTDTPIKSALFEYSLAFRKLGEDSFIDNQSQNKSLSGEFSAFRSINNDLSRREKSFSRFEGVERRGSSASIKLGIKKQSKGDFAKIFDDDSDIDTNARSRKRGREAESTGGSRSMENQREDSYFHTNLSLISRLEQTEEEQGSHLGWTPKRESVDVQNLTVGKAKELLFKDIPEDLADETNRSRSRTPNRSKSNVRIDYSKNLQLNAVERANRILNPTTTAKQNAVDEQSEVNPFEEDPLIQIYGDKGKGSDRQIVKEEKSPNPTKDFGIESVQPHSKEAGYEALKKAPLDKETPTSRLARLKGNSERGASNHEIKRLNSDRGTSHISYLEKKRQLEEQEQSVHNSRDGIIPLLANPVKLTNLPLTTTVPITSGERSYKEIQSQLQVLKSSNMSFGLKQSDKFTLPPTSNVLPITQSNSKVEDPRRTQGTLIQVVDVGGKELEKLRGELREQLMEMTKREERIRALEQDMQQQMSRQISTERELEAARDECRKKEEYKNDLIASKEEAVQISRNTIESMAKNNGSLQRQIKEHLDQIQELEAEIEVLQKENNKLSQSYAELKAIQKNKNDLFAKYSQVSKAKLEEKTALVEEYKRRLEDSEARATEFEEEREELLAKLRNKASDRADLEEAVEQLRSELERNENLLLEQDAKFKELIETQNAVESRLKERENQLRGHELKYRVATSLEREKENKEAWDRLRSEQEGLIERLEQENADLEGKLSERTEELKKLKKYSASLVIDKQRVEEQMRKSPVESGKKLAELEARVAELEAMNYGLTKENEELVTCVEAA